MIPSHWTSVLGTFRQTYNHSLWCFVVFQTIMLLWVSKSKKWPWAASALLSPGVAHRLCPARCNYIISEATSSAGEKGKMFSASSQKITITGAFLIFRSCSCTVNSAAPLGMWGSGLLFPSLLLSVNEDWLTLGWVLDCCFLLWWRWFTGFLCFVLTGVGGNLVAIQASRISTFLHFWSMPGVLPYKMRQNWPNPCTTFFSSGRPWALGVHVCLS